jgi:hypothetical protein
MSKPRIEKRRGKELYVANHTMGEYTAEAEYARTAKQA